MMWTAWQYRDVWDALYEQCDAATQMKLLQHLDLLKEKGNMSGRPISAPLKDGIFELRAKNARILFYWGSMRTVVFVHSLFKETRTIPIAEIRLADKRRTEILLLGIPLHALSNQN